MWTSKIKDWSKIYSATCDSMTLSQWTSLVYVKYQVPQHKVPWSAVSRASLRSNKSKSKGTKSQPYPIYLSCTCVYFSNLKVVYQNKSKKNVIWQSNVDLKNIPYLIAPVSMTVYSWNFKKDRKIVASCLKKKIPNSVVGKHVWLKTYTGCSSATTGTSKITVFRCGDSHTVLRWPQFSLHKKVTSAHQFFLHLCWVIVKTADDVFSSRRIVVVCLITFRVMLNHVMIKVCKFRCFFFYFHFLFA